MFPVETHQQSDPLVGVVLDGRYRVDTLIATGGMSGVYRGLDLRLDRPVALKIMDSRYAGDSQFLTRFQREARAVAKLKDPGLVAVYDQGIDGQHPFLVMELIEGGTLRELLVERGRCRRMRSPRCSAPCSAVSRWPTAQGLVHRDVKPENVLISDGGDVKIADFGLVRAIAEAKITSTSVILGTAAYLSPEQVSTGDAGPASDVYAVGILTYELLTGTTPFTRRHRADGGLSADGPRCRRAEFRDRRCANAIRRAGAASDRARSGADGTPTPRTWQRELDAIVDELGLPDFRVPAPRNSAQHLSAQICTAAELRQERHHRHRQVRAAATAHPRAHPRPAGLAGRRRARSETYGVAGQFAGHRPRRVLLGASARQARCCSSGWSRCSFSPARWPRPHGRSAAICPGLL